MAYKVLTLEALGNGYGVGVFFTLAGKEWGYVDAVRVTPADCAGGPSNVFWVEPITVNFNRDSAEITRAWRDCHGYAPGAVEMTRGEKFRATLRACICAGFFDPDSERAALVQVGAVQEPARENPGSWEPTLILAEGSSVEHYAKDLLRG